MAIVDTAAFIAVAADAGVAYVPRDQTEDFRKVLDEGAVRLTRMGLAHSTRLRTGNPETCIREVAKEIGADLVVVGHHKQGRLARWLHGSVTAELIEALDCSLLTARLDVSDEDLYGN
jgi:nucleotide-binding universal stress UspA family protein